ncbi:NADPH-dependent FMN reductase [Paenibacillus sp. FSL R7-269]|uniref:flavodoxin family protein n=1 Tax=Paenibacillus sp. FSL R7-269 TaxID=1226755 RepID=UPI0003E1D753|nr:flavodoxin family protein [Paenibacillus sp. FSL R7-269]ETT45585.1 NADPH-dependent FMN reductase [Paenibacillus sp. FSL R7-269]
MKKIIGLAGSMKKRHSSSEYLLSVALEAAAEQGVQTELLRLNDYNILPCDGCGNCMNGKHCHLLKDPEDQLTELYDKLKEADGFVFASPVYALSLPAVWKNWIDRCEPCSDEDLDFEYYNYDRVAGVKGKAFKGKVAGQIVVAAGPGHEWALASLMPCFTAIKLSMIASAGISLIEYDGQPGIRKRSWSKPIEEAEEAKMMARAVGMRVASSLGFSYFDLPGQSGGGQVNGDPGESHGQGQGLASLEQSEAWPAFTVQDVRDGEVTLGELASIQPRIFVIGDQQASLRCGPLLEQLKRQFGGTADCALIARVGQLPHFITHEFVKEKTGQTVPGFTLYYDWEDKLASRCTLAPGQPAILVGRSPGEWRLFAVDEADGRDIDRVVDYLEEAVV